MRPILLILCFFINFIGSANHNPERDGLNMELQDKVMSMYHLVDARYSSVVQEYIELYTGRYLSTLSDIVHRSDLFFPIVDQYIDKYHLPDQLKYISAIESALKPNAISRSKAVGLWQIMEPLAAHYHLRMDTKMDERMDLYKSSELAMIYLKDLYEQFGDWTVAIAAYNCGPGRMRRAMKAAHSKNYWELQSFLPRETQRYIPKFIAFNYLMQHYHDYIDPAMNLSRDARQIEYTIVYENLAFDELSELSGTDLETVKLLNAAYLQSYIPDNSEGYLVSLPSRDMGTFLSNYYQEGLDTVFHGIWPRYAMIPRYKIQRSNYKVQSGDNLYNLAMRYDCKISELKRWNNLDSDRLYPGQLLTVVCQAIDILPLERSDTKFQAIPHRRQVIRNNLEKKDKRLSITNEVFVPQLTSKYHVVDYAETIEDVAIAYHLPNTESLLVENPQIQKYGWRAGLKLRIPSAPNH